MPLERIYWLIALVIVFIILAIISLAFKHLRQQRSRYATYGARYRMDKEFALNDDELEPSQPVSKATVVTKAIPAEETFIQPLLTLPKTLCFYVKAKSHEKFFGYDLLQAILNQGFVHGNRDFFHFTSQQGSTLISLANANAPGTFNLDQMGAFTTTGLCLFIQPQRLVKPFVAFDLMIEKAHLLADELGGVVEDEHHHLLTPERLNDWRSHLDV